MEAVPVKEVDLDGRRCQVKEDLQSKGKRVWERPSERNLGRNFKHLGMLPTKKFYEEFATFNWDKDRNQLSSHLEDYWPEAEMKRYT